MPSMRSQPGILAPLAAFGRSLSFRLKPLGDPSAALALSRLQAGFDPDWGVAGLGEPLLRAVGASLSGIRTFPSFSGHGCSVPSTQQAVWIFLGAESRSLTFDRSREVQALLDETCELVDEQDTFQYQGGRDLTGFEDGTDNPDAEESVAVAFVDRGPLAGSSFVAVQRWKHDLACFFAHPGSARDAMIGRRRADNAEIDDAPASAHVKRSAQESFDPEAFLVRRSMPWVCAGEQGLEFIGYGRSFDAFEQILRRMAGLEDGIVDALFNFSQPVTGGYYWCPPLADGRLDFRALSLAHERDDL